MASSRIPGPLNHCNIWMPAYTPGPMGYNDQGDPNICTLLGDTPGPLGMMDYADPSLPRFGETVNLQIGRTAGGINLSLGAGGQVPEVSGNASGNITLKQLKAIFSKASDDYLQKVANDLNTDLAKYGLDSPLRRAHFFAQVRQEGGASLQATVESMQYNPGGLKGNFKYYRDHPDEAETDGYVRDAKTHKITRTAQQPIIANKAYANRNGNGAPASGDGWNYRGRGLIQVTGRANYADISSQYGKLYSGSNVDFVATPDLMAEFPYSIRSAVCFWIIHGLHKLADKGSLDADVDRITAVINKLTDSYGERRGNFKVAYNAFK
ncbi:MAG: hypothetical protein ABL919_15310 [Methylococcales bacterium]|nr:hypothetical protein [Methylococcaceae bacterium]